MSPILTLRTRQRRLHSQLHFLGRYSKRLEIASVVACNVLTHLASQWLHLPILRRPRFLHNPVSLNIIEISLSLYMLQAPVLAKLGVESFPAAPSPSLMLVFRRAINCLVRLAHSSVPDRSGNRHTASSSQ